MGTRLNQKTFEKMIQENIDELNKYMPEHSLEKKHTIDCLKAIIEYEYPKHDLPALTVDYYEHNDGSKSWIAHLKGTKLICSSEESEEKAIDELMTSIRVSLLHRFRASAGNGA